MNLENWNEMYGADYNEGASCPCCWNKDYSDDKYDDYDEKDNCGCEYEKDYEDYDCGCDFKKPERPSFDCGKRKPCCCCCRKNERPEKPDCDCDKHEKVERPACCCNCNCCGQCNCCCEKREEKKPCKDEFFICKKIDCKHECRKEKFDRHTWDDWNTWNPCGCKEKKHCVCRLFKCKF